MGRKIALYYLRNYQIFYMKVNYIIWKLANTLSSPVEGFAKMERLLFRPDN